MAEVEHNAGKGWRFKRLDEGRVRISVHDQGAEEPREVLELEPVEWAKAVAAVSTTGEYGFEKALEFHGEDALTAVCEESKAMLTKRAEADGLAIACFEVNDDGEELAKIDGKWCVVEGDDDVGLYEGDDGTLELTIVGSTEHDNRKVQVGLVCEGRDGSTEVRGAIADVLEPV